MNRLEPAGLAEYSDAAILAEIRRVSDLVEGPVFRQAAFRAHARVSGSVVWQRFGRWHAALERAGLVHRSVEQKTGRQRWGWRHIRRYWRVTDLELLDDLRRIARDKGSAAVRATDLKRFDAIAGASVYIRRFGTWRGAVAAAGLEMCPDSRRFTTDECVDNLRAVWAHLGRQPRAVEMRLAPSTIHAAPYRLRWGTWRHAVQDFIERVNADPGDPLRAMVLPWAGCALPKPPLRAEQRHTASAELRFQVLKRDRFRCVLCGASPANDEGCELHLDHVVPYSRGGQTVAANLRSLCAQCNQGRGPHGQERWGEKAA